MNPQTFVIFDEISDRLKTAIKGTAVKANSEAAIETFVNQRIPQIIAQAQAVFNDGRVEFFEIINLVRSVSSAVRDGLNIYDPKNDGDKAVIVREVIQLIAGQILPKGPVLETIQNDQYLKGVVEFVYRFLVKRQVF